MKYRPAETSKCLCFRCEMMKELQSNTCQQSKASSALLHQKYTLKREHYSKAYRNVSDKLEYMQIVSSPRIMLYGYSYLMYSSWLQHFFNICVLMHKTSHAGCDIKFEWHTKFLYELKVLNKWWCITWHASLIVILFKLIYNSHCFIRRRDPHCWSNLMRNSSFQHQNFFLCMLTFFKSMHSCHA